MTPPDSRSWSAGALLRTLCILVLLVEAACALPGGRDEVVVEGLLAQAPVAYACPDGERITAVYYRLSDNSLRFVKLSMPGGIQATLPAVASGSGSRYSDEREYVWWIKGRTGLLQVRDAAGTWRARFEDCTAQQE